ncbi:acyl-[acyl-carrier-protein] thioesterase [Natronococcus sp. A-GB1]|uniref:acyl-CoA thioesterase n=1 Tax=Natronococcus sp. A-GB1 TaxID=3037648 RepID=UPI00241BE9FA|nr:acyl-[acyl-carrier-protein] thioesterase [Natronococcus sp. A-GB1]MDG5760478.1 acyl-[acyl-carrier-protein] thioesterase [Natronococcus sp. A-GB1]
MQTIDDRRVQFGEFAGPLAHGASFFDWQLISTQEIAAAFDYSFAEILADDGIPYAPVVVSTSVDRYPRIGETISVETVPRRVGDSSVELVYEINDGNGERLATARMTHVTIGPDGAALELPEDVKAAFADASVDRDPSVGPHDGTDTGDGLASFSSSFEIHSPHIEGAELAYFEEYPRFADVALERHLETHDTPLDDLRGDKEPYRIRDWRWEFKAPVLFGTTLRVDCDVLEITDETIRIAHALSSDGRTNIEGITEYGCFDRSGAPVAFDEAMLEPYRT